MARKLTFECTVNADNSVSIKTIAEGSFDLVERYGLVELCKVSVTNDHNRGLDQSKKSRKKLKS